MICIVASSLLRTCHLFYIGLASELNMARDMLKVNENIDFLARYG